MSAFDTYQMLTKIAKRLGGHVVVEACVSSLIPGMAFRVIRKPDNRGCLVAFDKNELEDLPTDVVIEKIVARMKRKKP